MAVETKTKPVLHGEELVGAYERYTSKQSPIKLVTRSLTLFFSIWQQLQRPPELPTISSRQIDDIVK